MPSPRSVRGSSLNLDTATQLDRSGPGRILPPPFPSVKAFFPCVDLDSAALLQLTRQGVGVRPPISISRAHECGVFSAVFLLLHARAFLDRACLARSTVCLSEEKEHTRARLFHATPAVVSSRAWCSTRVELSPKRMLVSSYFEAGAAAASAAVFPAPASLSQAFYNLCMRIFPASS